MMISPRTAASIDELCRRDCSFALCRVPGAEQEQFFMQEEGDCQRLSPLQPMESSGFLIKPFQHRFSYFIAQQCQGIPDALRFPLLKIEALASCPSQSDYVKAFSFYHEELLKQAEIKKLVLARSEDVEFGADFSPTRSYQKACETYPHCFCALFHHPQLGTWLSATPELLIKGGDGDEWQSMALAGTQKKGGHWSQKNLSEHDWVVRHLSGCFTASGCSFHQSPTRTMPFGEIEHLCTRFTFSMEKAMLPHLLHQLPPTPAVCGYPVRLAQLFIKRHALIDYSCYAGHMGICSAHEQSHLYVTLRCMQIFEKHCRLYAGGGIMPDSQVEEEFEETRLKMQAMKSII